MQLRRPCNRATLDTVPRCENCWIVLSCQLWVVRSRARTEIVRSCQGTNRDRPCLELVRETSCPLHNCEIVLEVRPCQLTLIITQSVINRNPARPNRQHDQARSTNKPCEFLTQGARSTCARSQHDVHDRGCSTMSRRHDATIELGRSE